MKTREVSAWTRSELAMALHLMDEMGQEAVEIDKVPGAPGIYIVTFRDEEDGSVAESGKVPDLNPGER